MNRAGRSGLFLTLFLLAAVAAGLLCRAWWTPGTAPDHRAPRQAATDASPTLPDRMDPRVEKALEAPPADPVGIRSEPSTPEEPDASIQATELAGALEALDGAARAGRIAREVSGQPSPEVCQVAATRVVSDLLGGSERPMSSEERQSCCDALLRALTPRQPAEARRPIVVAVLAAGSLPQVESLVVYLERQEPDAGIQAWGTGAARAIRDAGGARDAELLASLVRRLEPEGR
ncbi:MAG: hypothetical protein AAB434_01670 [Planctomycetota bacterium]